MGGTDWNADYDTLSYFSTDLFTQEGFTSQGQSSIVIHNVSRLNLQTTAPFANLAPSSLPAPFSTPPTSRHRVVPNLSW